MIGAGPLQVRFTRKRDESVVLDLRRADGTSTWQRCTDATGRFFAVHDLTHFAVETTLGLRRAFYGLVREGWGLDDFGPPWPKGPLPPEALRAEMIVGSFATAWASGVVPNAADCNAGMDSYADERGIAALQHVTEDEMLRIREALAPRLRTWNELPVGRTMELHFSE